MLKKMERYPFLSEATVKVIKRLRAQYGYSQERLAEKSGLDRLYILQLEQGKFRPTLNSIFFLADGFGMEPNELIKIIQQERREIAASQ